MYDLHRLRLLRELSHRGTLAAVAQALSYNPSSVSHQLGLLEREVGVPLLEPVGRRVRLTPAARTLVEHTEAILLELERAEAAIAASRSEIAGRVHIATFQTAAHTFLLEAMDLLARTHPLLSVTFTHVNSENAIPALIARDFDLVLSEEYPGVPSAPHPGVETVVIAEDPLTLAIRTGATARGLEDLADTDWIMEPAGTLARAWAMSRCRSAGYEPRVTYESTDIHLHLKLVAHGQANAFLPGLGIVVPPGIRTFPTGHARRITASIRTGSDINPTISTVRDQIVGLMNAKSN
jgi:DNA-binding transcriptional LysR family regulator